MVLSGKCDLASYAIAIWIGDDRKEVVISEAEQVFKEGQKKGMTKVGDKKKIRKGMREWGKRECLRSSFNIASQREHWARNRALVKVLHSNQNSFNSTSNTFIYCVLLDITSIFYMSCYNQIR